MDNLNDRNLKDNSFLADKSQRLAKAIYLVSSFISDNDPVKRKLRELSLSLLAIGRNFVSNDFVRDTAETPFNLFHSGPLVTELQELFSYLDLALVGGLISEMNFTILSQEINALLDLAKRLNDPELLHKFMSQPTLSTGPNLNLNQTDLSLKDRNLDSRFVLDKAGSGAFPSKSKSLEPGLGRAKTSSSASPLKAQDKADRKKNILDFVTGRGWTSIKDIASTVTDCSEKTIQRELALLVDQGRLKKQGERRWSRYMLA